jgi:hypothetical protein
MLGGYGCDLFLQNARFNDFVLHIIIHTSKQSFVWKNDLQFVILFPSTQSFALNPFRYISIGSIFLQI